MRKFRNILLPALLAAAVLCGCGGQDHAAPQVQTAPEPQVEAVTAPPLEPDTQETPALPVVEDAPEAEPAQTTPDAVASPTPDDTPEPVEPEQAAVTGESALCTISISCTTLLDHLDELAPEKAPLVPEDGWILAPIEVSFSEGESVFDLLQRVCTEEKIHLEFTDTPIYNSAYIEGIHNLYEFDCGSLSGWTYSVNGWFPNYGCSCYQLQDGDVVCWQYTYDMGADVRQN